jgi:hypothetical protein
MFIAPIIAAAISAFAPAIGDALSSSSDSIKQKAIDVIKQKTGVDLTGPIDQVKEQVMGFTADQKLSILQAENDFKLKDHEIDSEDLENAYKRDIDFANAKWGWISLSTQNIGALVVLIIFLTMTFWGLFYKSAESQDTTQIINTNYNIILLLVGYWWGKSKRDDE